MPEDVAAGHNRDNICGPHFTALARVQLGTPSDFSDREVKEKCVDRPPALTH